MFDRCRRNLSFANVMSIVAVFIALGGSALALSRNSVGSRQLKPGGVHASDIGNDAVTSDKVADGSLLDADFAAGQLPQGEQGVPGAPGTAVAYVELNADGTINTNTGASNITPANITHTAGTGIYCFRGLPAGTKTMMAVPSGAFGTAGYRDTSLAATFDNRASPALGGCTTGVDVARVATVDLNNAVGDTGGTFTPTASDEPFLVWFED